MWQAYLSPATKAAISAAAIGRHGSNEALSENIEIAYRKSGGGGVSSAAAAAKYQPKAISGERRERRMAARSLGMA